MLSFVTLFRRLRAWRAVLPVFTLVLFRAPSLWAQQRDPLVALVDEALRNNLGLKTERLAEDRTARGGVAAAGG